jgi:hypothetical protein
MLPQVFPGPSRPDRPRQSPPFASTTFLIALVAGLPAGSTIVGEGPVGKCPVSLQSGRLCDNPKDRHSDLAADDISSPPTPSASRSAIATIEKISLL